MSARIRRLDDEVRKKIAAGEVIEGPSSVVKELIENAVDAGSTEIAVTVENAGLKKIVVADNGSGIHPEDFDVAALEHATSKISSIDDILAIGTYGFRGEALSSISSVSRLTIMSRREELETGVKMVCDRGEREQVPWAGPRGTVISVENLFYTVPARKKFLKSVPVELRRLRDELLRSALYNFAVAYTLDVDGKRQVTLPADKTRFDRFRAIYGRELAEGCYEVDLADLKVSVSGYLSRPGFLRSSRSWQAVYINGRPVDYSHLGFHLSRAYEAVAGAREYPVAFIFIEIDATLVDVNIHPSKREVKLFDQRYIDQLIGALAGKALNRSHSLDSASFRTPPGPAKEFSDNDRFFYPAKEDTFSMPALFSRSDFPGTTGDENQEISENGKPWRYIGELFATFLVAEKDDDLVIIDFHAAHERFLFDTLLSRNESVEQQELLYPEMIELSLADYRLVVDERESLEAVGVAVEDFGENSVVVRSIPSGARGTGRDILLGFIEESRSGFFDPQSRIKAAAASVACHRAKRSGDILTRDDAEDILGLVFGGRHELRCPHGRPFIFTMTKNELEKMVSRQ